MQRLANQCLHASVPAQSALLDLVRRLAGCQTHAALHTSAAQWRKQQLDDESPSPSDEEPAGSASDSDVEAVSEGEASASDEDADTQAAAAAAAAGSAAEQQHTQQHLGLDDPSLHILLR
jgi:hypothetical protein